MNLRPLAVEAIPLPTTASVVSAAPRTDLSIDFAPTRFATTLAEAVLRYRISIINRGTQPLGPLVIFGAMETAGPDEEQGDAPGTAPRRNRPFRAAPGFNPHPHFTPYTDLSELGHAEAHDDEDLSAAQPLYPARGEVPAPPAPPEPATLSKCHHLMVLQPGEGADFAGQMRLPLADIAPIQLGSAAFFVPLVRLRVEAGQIADDGAMSEPYVRELCLIVGEAKPEDGTGMQPPSLGPLRLAPDTTTADQLAIRTIPLHGASQGV